MFLELIGETRYNNIRQRQAARNPQTLASAASTLASEPKLQASSLRVTLVETSRTTFINSLY